MMLEALALFVTAVRLRLKRGKPPCRWETQGIMLDGGIIEACDRCTRVRVYMVDRDGSPLGIAELNRLPDEDVGDAILRVYREQNGNDSEGLT